MDKSVLKKIFLMLTPSIILLISNIKSISGYIANNKYIGGWDGDGMFGMLKIFSEQSNMFSNLFVPNWNMGSIWPSDYSPFLTYILSPLFSTFSPNELLVFKIFNVTMLALTPLLIYLLIHKSMQFSRYIALSSAILYSLIISIDYGIGLSAGISIKSILETGYISQLFGFNIFLLFLISFYGRNQNRKIISGVLLGLIIVSNIHVTLFAIIFILSHLVLNIRERSVIIDTLTTSIIALLISSYWWIDILINSSSYLVKTVVNVDFFLAYIAWGVFLSLAILTVLLNIYTNKHNKFVSILFLTAILSFLLTVLPIYQILENIPLQPHRILPMSGIFFALTSSIGILSYIEKSKLHFSIGKHHLHIKFLSLIFITLITAIYPLSNEHDLRYLSDDDLALINFLSERDNSRSIIEVWHNIKDDSTQQVEDKPVHTVISGQVPAKNSSHEMLWGIFRESSISSPFIQPLRNGFSYYNESYGVKCDLCKEESNFDNKSFEYYTSLAEDLGVNLVVLRSETAKSQMRLTNAFQDSISFGDWEVFILSQEKQIKKTNNSEVVLTFTKMNGTEDFDDWYDINEELLTNEVESFIFAKSNNDNLDTNEEFKKFDHIFINKYQYQDIDKAFTNLESEANDSKSIFLIESKDILFERLTRLGLDNIIVVNEDNFIEEIGTSIASKNKSDNQGREEYIYNYNFSVADWIDLDGEDYFLATPSRIITIK